MGRIEVLERLTQMVADASSSASAKITAIARRMAADGMLMSGNFYTSEKEALQSIYDDALKKMEAYSLSIIAPKAAANAVRVAALELEAQMLARFEGVLRGEQAEILVHRRRRKSCFLTFADFCAKDSLEQSTIQRATF